MEVLFAIAVLLLGHDDFRVREQSHRFLTLHADNAIFQLLAGERSTCPEIAGRCRILATAWYTRNAERIVDRLKPPGWRNFPWLAMPDENGNMSYFGSAGDYARRATGMGIKDEWPDHNAWSEGTRLRLQEMVAARLPVAGFIRACMDFEWTWRTTHGLPLHGKKR